MATIPKTKPAATSKAAPKSAPDKTQKAASKAPSPAPEKERKAAEKTKTAPKVAAAEISKTASKDVVKAASKPAPVPAAKAVIPEPGPETDPATIADSSLSAKNVQKTAHKTDEKTVAKAASPVAQKGQKWLEIKVILEKIKEDTLHEINKSVKNGTDAVATNEPGGDIYDQASSERDRELGLLLGDREREKLHNIDEALLRIVEGEYGICEECDEDIPLGRLKAMPFTRHCVKCKSDLEKLQAQTKRFEEDRAYREIPLGSEEEEG